MFNKIFSIFQRKPNLKLLNKRILYIEDNAIDRKVVEKILTSRNFKVLLSPDGEAGIKTAIKEKPDLILLDIVLPGMSGVDVCKSLKDEEATKNIPVVFLTGSDTPKNLIDCYEFGAEDYLKKGVSAKTLISQIELILTEINS